MIRLTLAAIAVISLPVLAGACGAEPSLEDGEVLGEASQELPYDPIPPPKCDLSADWLFRYYSDITRTTQVGAVHCLCGEVSSSGEKTRYVKLSSYPACVL